MSLRVREKGLLDLAPSLESRYDGIRKVANEN